MAMSKDYSKLSDDELAQALASQAKLVEAAYETVKNGNPGLTGNVADLKADADARMLKAVLEQQDALEAESAKRTRR